MPWRWKCSVRLRFGPRMDEFMGKVMTKILGITEYSAGNVKGAPHQINGFWIDPCILVEP